VISVITAALPSRLDRLCEACASVRAQTHPAAEHLVAIDYDRRGSAATRNALLRAATGEWVAVLDDDDLLMPRHLETLLAASQDADVVYSFCAVEGRPGWSPNRTFDAEALRQGNYIPVTALIRRSLLDELGGWKDSALCPYGFEDWQLWLDALTAGARFVCVPEVTWVYRLHEMSKTFVGERAAA
jgi:glycosyltransferase involved in cell wall biosynthesis